MRTVRAALCLALAGATFAALGANPPEVDRGLQWLASRIQADGSVGGEQASIATAFQVRTEVVLTSSRYGTGSPALADAVSVEPDSAVEYVARKIVALAAAGRDASGELATLATLQNSDGGFGGAAGYQSNPLDTSFAILALKAAGSGTSGSASSALAYLVAAQSADGSFAINEQPSVYVTSYALQAFNTLAQTYPVAASAQSAKSWLVGVQASGAYTTVLDNAFAAIALAGTTTDATAFGGAQAALKSSQLADGSWSDDPYLSAVAIRALMATGTAGNPPTTGQITGIVADGSSSAPIAGVTVQVSGPTSATTTTVTGGTFLSGGLNPGAYSVQFSLAGYTTVTQTVNVAAGVTSSLGTVYLPLAANSAALQGVVKDGTSGSAVVGATVSVGSLTAQTDASGNYRIVGITPGSVAVTVTQTGYQAISVPATFAAGATLFFSPTLYANGATVPATSITVTVIASATQHPIVGATVSTGGLSAATNSSGSATLSGIAQGSATIQASAAGYQSLSIAVLVGPGGNTGPTMALSGASQSITLSGTITDSATLTAIGGATVRVQNVATAAMTDANGQYQVSGITSTQFTVTVSAAGYSTKTVNVTLSQLADSRLDVALGKSVSGAGLSVTSTTTDSPSYPPFSDIEITMNIQNATSTAQPLVFGATLLDANSNAVLQTSGQAFTVAASGATPVIIDLHNTSQPAGNYSVVMQGVDADGVVRVEGSASLSIVAVARISGSVILNPPVAEAGTSVPISIGASISNHGNLPIPSGPLQLTIALDAPFTSYSPLGQTATGPPLLSGAPLNRPVGAVYDSSGALWVLNGGDGKILSLTKQADGSIVTQTWLDPATISPNPFPSPVGLTIDASGNLYVLNVSNTIYQVSPSKVLTKITTNVTNQSAIASNGQQTLYVSATSIGTTLYSVNLSGNVSNPVVTPIVGPGFNSPSGIAVGPDGSTYVSNQGANTIAKISPQGAVTTFIASGLSSPGGLAITGSGDLLIANGGTNTILRASTTAATPTLQAYGTGLNSPGAITLGPDGTLYVANKASNASIATIPSGGGTAQVFVASLVPSPVGMTYDPSGNLYVVGSAGDFMEVISAGTISSLPRVPGATAVAPGPGTSILVSSSGGTIVPYPSNGSDIVSGLNWPAGMAAFGGSLVYVAERFGNCISIVDMSARKVMPFAPSFVNTGDDLYFAPNGDRYILNGSRIDRVGASSGATFTKSDVSFNGQAFVPTASGGFYVVESGSIKAVSATGAVSVVSTGSTSLPSLSFGAALDAGGNILVGDRFGHRILRVNPTTGVVDTFADLSAISTSQLWTLTGDGAGGVFAAPTDGKIVRVASTGGNPSLLTTLTAPANRLDFDPVGNTLYAKTGNDVRYFNIATPGQVTITTIPGGNTGSLRYANGLIHVINGTADLRSYTPQGVLVSTLAGFNQPTSLVWDGTRVVVVDSTKTISIVPGQLPQTLADDTVNALTLVGGTLYGVRSSSVYTLPSGSRTYSAYYTQTGPTALIAIAGRSDGALSLANQVDQRVLTIDASRNIIASYAGVSGPTGIALDAAGNVYVASSGFSQIVKVNPVTRQSVIVDSSLSAGGIAIVNGTLLAIGGNRLYSYDATGNRTQAFFDGNASYGAITASGGFAYVADASQLKVSRWDGTTMSAIASGLNGVNALAYGPDGALYTGGRFGSATRVANGQILQLAGNLGSLSALTVTPAGQVYAGDALGYLTTFDPVTFVRHDISNLAQLVSAQRAPGVLFLATDASGAFAGGVGTTPAEVYHVTYTPPPAPAAAGTVLLTTQVTMPDLPVGATVPVTGFAQWPVPYPGDFDFTLQRTDTVTGAAVNTLHVGPSASGVVTLSAAKVPPGNQSVRVSTQVTGGDFASVARIDPSGLRLFTPQNFLTPRLMGADALGRIYVSQGTGMSRSNSSGTFDTIWNQNAGTRGTIPVDSRQNFYAIAGAANNEIFGISSSTLQQVSHDTLPENVLAIVVDSQDAIWALTQKDSGLGYAVGKLWRLVPGSPAVQLTAAPIRSPYSLSIDGKDNLYVHAIPSGTGTGGVLRFTRDGASSVVISPDATGDPSFEYEGVSVTGDCADNIFVAPLSWKKYGQGAGWAFPQFEEEHVLLEVNATTGKVSQVFDGALLSKDLTDLDGIIYDRFGGQLLIYSERWVTTGGTVGYRLPVTCGNISTDLHVVVPSGQAASGYSVAPSSVIANADGSTELVWTLQSVAAAGQSVSFDTTLANLNLGEIRPAATQAFLLFQDTFTASQVKVPLAVPSVTVDGFVDVGVGVSPEAYPANTPIVSSVTLTSRDLSQPHTGNLVITVTDAQGALLAQVGQQAVTVPAASAIAVPVSFNTATYLSGSYLVKAQLADPSTGIVLSSSSASFDILADATPLLTSLSSDKVSYQPVDTVTLDARGKNVALNTIASGITLSVVVRDPSDNVIYSGSRTLNTLVPGALQDAFFRFSLSGAPSGQYSAQLTAAPSGDPPIPVRTTSFSVLSTVDTGSGVQGSLSAQSAANSGDSVNLVALIADHGNAALANLPVTFRVIDPRTGAAIFTQSTTANVPQGGEQAVSLAWNTTGIAPGTFIAAASATFSGREVALGQANIRIGAIQPFSFAPQTNAPLDALVESSGVTVTGIVAPAPISITGGEFQIGNGLWSGSVGTVLPGDVVTVRVAAASTFNTTTIATLTIAGFSAPFSVTTLNPRVTPDPVSFTALANVPLGSVQTSNTVTISGIDTAVPISIVGGQYSVNGGPWTSAAGTVNNGDIVAVRVTAAATAGTAITATLTVSNVSATFSVTTTAQSSTPNAFSFVAQNNVPVSTVVTSNTVTIGGINVAVPISVTGGEYSVNGGAFTSAAGTIANGNTVAVRQTSSSSFSRTTTTVLTVSTVSGSFAVTTQGGDTSPDPFAFTEQTGVALNASIVSNSVSVSGINTSVPVSITGGEYRLNAGAYTSAAGTLNPLDTVTVRQTSSSSFATKTTATLTVSDFSAPFSVTTKNVANVGATAVLSGADHLLVLMSCKSNDDGDDDSSCAQQRVSFIDAYLTTLGVSHKIVSAEDAFKGEFRSGKYDAYWVSGGAEKLDDDLASEILAAGFRGETVVIDGVHDSRNKALDDVVGVFYKGKPSHLDTVTLTATFLPAGSFTPSGAKPIRVELSTGIRQAKFNTGDPAIVTNTYGLGNGLLFAFDLAGTLAAQPSSTLLQAMLADSLDYVAPAVPAALTGGAYVPFSIDLKNNESVTVTMDVTVGLPAGFALVATTPAASQSGATVTWHVTAAAGSVVSLEGAIRTPNTSGTYSLPVTVTQTYGTTSATVGTYPIPIIVKGIDTALPQLISALQAVSLSSHGDRSARDNAVAKLQSAQTSIGQARWDDAISKLADASDELDSIDGADVTSYRVSVDNVMKEVEQRWWAALPPCPSGLPCRTP